MLEVMTVNSGIEKFLPLWGEWTIEGKLGEGSFGAVYKAKRETFGYTDFAAIKHVSIPKDEAELNRIYDELGTREIQAVKDYLKDIQSQLITEYRQMMEFEGNTNIVACHDIMSKEKEDSLGYDIFIRMELLESVSTRAIENKMSTQETIKLGIDICSALTLLQEHKMIHRDIKPQNLFVNERGDYKLGDFGTARSIIGNSAQMSIKGTVAYMAPEVANRGEVGFTADIYSLGLVMYRLLNGYRTPLISADESSTVAHIDQANERRLKGEMLPAPSEADAMLSAIVLKACAFDPKDRWQSAAEMQEMLLELDRGTSLRVDSLTDEEKKKLEEEVRAAKERAKCEEQKRKEEEAISEKKKKQKRIKVILVSAAACILIITGVIIGYSAYKKDARYNDAVAAFEGEKLDDALVQFEKISGYREADDYIQRIHEEKDRQAGYAEAQQKLDEGEYGAAQTLFEKLGEYRDSSDKAVISAGLKNKEAQYQKALENMENSKYDVALSQFKSLEEYRDASEQAEIAQKWLKYNEAGELFSKGENNEAKKIYQQLKGFADADKKLEQVEQVIQNESLYQQAITKFNNGKYEDALKAFNALGEFSEAKQWAEKAQGKIDAAVVYSHGMELLESEKYEEALKVFSSIKDFSDAAGKAKEAQGLIDSRKTYNEAVLAENIGNYDVAKSKYESIGDFSDAEAKAAEMQQYLYLEDANKLIQKEEYEAALKIIDNLTIEAAASIKTDAEQKLQQQKDYRSAQTLEKSGKYAEAKAAYDEMTGYKDADARSAEMQRYLDYAAAAELRNAGEFEKAKEAFEALGNFRDAAEQMAAMQGKIDESNKQKAYEAARSLENEKQYEAALKAYTNLGGFLDSKDRAQEMSNWVKYNKAQALMDEENYQDALDIYQELSESFEDVKDKRILAKQENERKSAYEQAVHYQENGQYEKALQSFEKLGDYKDSEERAKLTSQPVNYNKAVQLSQSGEYEKARDIFQSLGEYNDAPKQAAEMQHKIDYNYASRLVKDEKFDEAIEIYTRLAEIEYSNSEYLKKQAEQKRDDEKAYKQALDLVNEGKFDEARKAFTQLGDYKDAVNQAKQMQLQMRYLDAETYLSQEKFEDAIKIFTELSEQRFSDSEERIRQAEAAMKTEQDYQAALEMFANGQYREAYNAFNQLKGYKESVEKKNESLGYVKYQTRGDESGAIVLGNPLTGENLFMNSAVERSSENGRLLLNVRDILETYVDLPITISFDAKTDGSARTITISAYQSSGISVADSMEFSVPSDRYQRYSYTTSVKDYLYKTDSQTGQKLSGGAIEISDGTDDNEGFTLRNIKIEIGTDATQWGFAPGDPLITGINLLTGGGQMRLSSQGKIKVDLAETLKNYVGQPVTVSFEAKATGESLRMRVSSDTNGTLKLQESKSFDVVPGDYQKYTYHSVVQTGEGKNDSNTLFFECLGRNQKDFCISKLKIEVGVEATEWSYALNDPAVTGNNLLKNSALVRVAKSGTVRVSVADVLDPYIGMPVCISFDGKADEEGLGLRVGPYQNSGISIEENHEFTLTTDYQRYSFTDRINQFVSSENATVSSYGQSEIAFISNTYKGFSIKNIKIEIGDHATAWTFALNDPLVTGDNLLTGGGQTRKSQSGKIRIDVRDALEKFVGQPVTVSFEAKAEGKENCTLEVGAYQESGISIADKVSFRVNNKQFNRFSFTTTVTNYGFRIDKETGEVYSGGSILFADIGTSVRDFSIRNIKIETGTAATGWNYAANDPVVTGENLLKNSAKVRQANENGFLSVAARSILEPYTGMMVTVSFDAKTNTDNNMDIQVYPYQDSGISVEGNRKFHLTPEYKRYSFVSQVQDFGIREKNGQKLSRGEIAFNNSDRQSFSVKNIKIEIGTKDTAWSFAPDDPLLAKEGINLLVGSGKTIKSENGYLGINVRDILANYVGQPVTISFEVKAEGDKSRKLQMYAYQSSGISIGDKFEFTADVKQYKRVSFTTTVTNYGIRKDPQTGENLSSGYLSFYDPGTLKQDFSIRLMKIEVGTKATSWSLAPNDPLVTGENLLIGGGQTRKSNVNGFLGIDVRDALDKCVGEPITISFEAMMNGEEARTLQMYAYQDSGISIADKFEFKVEPKQYQQFSFTTWGMDYGIRVNPETGEEYSNGVLAFFDPSTKKQIFSIRHIKIETGFSPSEWTLAVNDPLVNGENLLTDSARERRADDGFLSVNVKDALEPYIGIPVTISFDAKADTVEDLPIRIYPYQSSGISIRNSHVIHLSTTYKRYSFTDYSYLFGVRKDDYRGQFSEGEIAFFSEERKGFDVKNIKIELGNKDTAWTFAPGDPLLDAIGTNLLIGGGKTRSSESGFLGVDIRDALAEYVDQPVTISFEAMTASETNRTLRVYAYQSSGISISDGAEVALRPGEFNEYVIHTFVRDYGIRTDSETRKMLSNGSLAFYDQSGQNFQIRNIKIEIGSEKTDWSYALNDPAVSGENLLMNSARARMANENGFLSIITGNILQSHVGMTVCVSFDAKTNTANDLDIQVYPYQDSGISIAGSREIHLTPTYQRYSFVGRVQDFGIREKNGQILSVGELALYSQEHKRFTVKNIKIEIGTKPTSWDFASGDPVVTGNNLLKDSAKIRSANNGMLMVDVWDALGSYAGMPICVSFEAKADKEEGLLMQVSPANDTGISIEDNHSFGLTTAYKRYSFTDWVSLPGENSGNIKNRGGITFSSAQNKGFSVRNIKIEVGVKATDWSLAPNDNVITGDNLLVGGGKTRKSNDNGFLGIDVRNALEKYVGQPVTVSFEAMMEGTESRTIQVYAYQSSGISIADQCQFEVEPRQYKRYFFTTSVINYGDKYDRKTGKLLSNGQLAFYDPSTIKQQFSVRNVKIEVGFEMTEWRYAQNDPMIDRKNLLIDSAKVRQSENGFLRIGVLDSLKSYLGQYVCVSFDAKVNENEGFAIRVYPYQDSGISISGSNEFMLTSDYKRYSFVGQVTDFGIRYGKDGNRMSSGEIAFYNSDRLNFIVKNVKIEVGNKDTPWAFAPNDPLMKIRGVNLLPGTGEEKRSENGFISFNVFGILGKYVNQPITISFEARMAGNESRNLRMYAYQNSGISIADSIEFTVEPGQYRRFAFTTLVQDYGIRIDPITGKQYSRGYLAFNDPSTLKEEFDIRYVKIEIGSEATGWTPAPMN